MYPDLRSFVLTGLGLPVLNDCSVSISRQSKAIIAKPEYKIVFVSELLIKALTGSKNLSILFLNISIATAQSSLELVEDKFSSCQSVFFTPGAISKTPLIDEENFVMINPVTCLQGAS